MRHALLGALSIAAAATFTGCGLIEPPVDSPDPGTRVSPHSPHVTHANQIGTGRGSLLTVIRGRTPAMQIVRSPSEPCPEIIMRGRSSLVGPSNPVIYVDGIRTSNTCVLEMLNSNDVERVEVYPMGIAPGGQHRNSPTGLILVYMKRV